MRLGDPSVPRFRQVVEHGRRLEQQGVPFPNRPLLARGLSYIRDGDGEGLTHLTRVAERLHALLAQAQIRHLGACREARALLDSARERGVRVPFSQADYGQLEAVEQGSAAAATLEEWRSGREAVERLVRDLRRGLSQRVQPVAAPEAVVIPVLSSGTESPRASDAYRAVSRAAPRSRVPSPRHAHRPPARRPVGPPSRRNGPYGQERLRGPGGRRRTRWGLTVVVSVALAAIMLLSTNTGVVSAAATPPVTISVTGLGPQTTVAGNPVTVTAHVSNGMPLSSVNGSFSGYLVFFFYGQTNATGAIGYDKQFVPTPTGCTTPDQVCAQSASFSFQHTYDHVGSYDTSLTVYDAAGDYAIATEVVTVDPPVLNVQAASNLTTAPEDSPIHFTASVVTNPTSDELDTFAYEWDFGDNSTDWGNPIDHAFSESGNYVVTVRAYDNLTGAANQTSVTDLVITNPSPHAEIAIVTSTTLGTDRFPEDSPVTFSAASSTDVPTDLPQLRYFWSFGDGALGAGLSATHVYTESGTYTVTLTVTDEANLQSSTTTTVTIANAGPVASAASTSQTPIPVGTVGVLNASSTTDVPTDLPLENYTWSTAYPYVTDMNGSYGILGRDGYFQPGTFPAGLTVTDEENQYSGASTHVQVFDSPPSVGLDSAYTLVNVTLLVYGPPGTVLNLSVWANGHLVAGGNASIVEPPGTLLTFTGVPLYLADQDTISITDVGQPPPPHAAAVRASLTLTFSGDGPSCTSAGISSSLCSPETYTHDFTGEPGASNLWNVSGNAASLGRLVYLRAQVFSPAWTKLTTAWDFGDGATAPSTTYAPYTAEPTLGWVTTTHRWLPGGPYTLGLTTTDLYGGTSWSNVSVYELSGSVISGVAPFVNLTLPSTTPAAPSTTLPVSLRSQDFASSAFDVAWQFGDGQGTNAGTVGPSSTVTHFFPYSATQYAVVVYASGTNGGPTAVNWTFLRVTNGPPVPSIAGPGAAEEFSVVTFSGSSSVDYSGAPAGQNLTYAWNFGDGQSTGVSRGAGEVAGHVYTREGIFTVTLTVTDLEGLSASTSVEVDVTDVPVVATLSNRTVVVDEFSTFSVARLTGAPTDLAQMNAVWNWGDGSLTTQGFSVGHTYLKPGNYTQSVRLVSGEDLSSAATLTANVTVLDQPLSVNLPYGGYVVYGENHTATFRADVLSSAADRSLGPNAFTYHWQLGDGSKTVTDTSGLTDSIGHVYSLSGNPVLNVTVDGPNGTIGRASATLNSVPNWDGDGIPDEYASLILNAPVGNDPAHGTGLTDFMSAFVVHGASPTADTNGDGLTDFQDVFGTVTGYVTSPLDPNVAGDGISNGGHEFVDTFRAPRVVNFTSSGSVSIPGVYHPSILDAAAIRNITLYLEIVSPKLSSLTVSLADGGGTPVSLGGMSAPVANFPLLNSTPTGGPQSLDGFSVSQFQQKSTWNLGVTGGNGTIESASILIDYYTNPNLADPFASGLLLGNDISVPLYNTSESPQANYTVFDGTTMTYSTVYYYPYTLSYYKLSVVQGVPYYPWDNASYNADLNSSTGTTVSDPHAYATYYGDKEFGIGPWDTHAAGDSALTNGMKAYGATTYTETANHYLNYSSGSYYSSERTPYAGDPLESGGYAGPLNPTAFSTGTNGAADSQAVDPVGGPLVLGVTLYSANSNEVDGVLNDFNLKGIVQVNDSNYPGYPSIFTPATKGSVSVVDVSHSWHNYTFGAHGVGYQLPIESSAKSITIDLSLYLNFSLTLGSVAFRQYTFDTVPGKTYSYSDSNFDVSFTILQLVRMPVVLLNSTGEVHDLPGYGLHWHGDQHFYTFYLTMNDSGAGTPFQGGDNLLLVSETAFENSSFNQTVAQGKVSALPFLGGASFTKRGTSSAAFILGSLTATLNSSNALQLVAALTPHNGSGNVMGGFEALTQTQFELLGLDAHILSSAPYFPVANYDSPAGTPRQTFWQALGNLFTSIVDAIVSVILAIGNFLVNLVQEIGQAIVGLWNQFVSAVQSAIKAIAKAFDFIAQWIQEQFQALQEKIKAAFSQVMDVLVGKLVLPFLSFLYDLGILNATVFNDTYSRLATEYGIPDPPALGSPAAVSLAQEILNGVLAGLAGLAVVIGTLLYIIGIVTAGAAEVAIEGSQVAETAAALTTGQIVAAVVVGSILGAISFFGVVQSIVSAVAPNSAVGNFFSSLTNGPILQAINGVAGSIFDILGTVLDFALTYFLLEISGVYVAGAVLGTIGAILAGIAGVMDNTSAEQMVVGIALNVVAIVVSMIALFMNFLPEDEAAADASNTQILSAGGVLLTAGTALGALGGLAYDFGSYLNDTKAA